MREIKFRAWVEMEIFTGMIDVDVIRFDNKVISGLSKNNGHVGTILPNAKLMQYTGLKDKNGVEIFEGDIIKVIFEDCELSNYITEVREFGEVDVVGQYHYDVTLLKWLNGSIHNDSVEIIGNIYENPELLGV